ncbi:MAG: helix-turn-helix domain-containing protein [Treponema sp.]|jgi:excisionase family DNA binding protein|nr:helix-turn-helix domain-containing protein [Treponema sp.]
MKNDAVKNMLILTLQHIQQTNEFLSTLISVIKDTEEEPHPYPVIKTVEEYPELLSVSKAAEFIGVSRGSLYRFIHERKIPCYKPSGKRVYFKRSELENFLFRNKQFASYEIAEKAEDILNNRERKIPHPHRKNR